MPRDRRSGSAETSQSDRFIQEGRKTQHERPSAQEGRGSGGRKEDKSAEEGIEGPLVKDAMNSQEREQKDAGNDTYAFYMYNFALTGFTQTVGTSCVFYRLGLVLLIKWKPYNALCGISAILLFQRYTY